MEYYAKKANQAELLAPADATIVNVQDVKKVCIVCPPLVVIVPPVELGDTPSEPSVAYEMTTTPEPPLPPAPDPPPPPHHHPVFAVPAVPAFASQTPPAPHPPVPPAPFVVNSDCPPPHHPA